MGNTCVAEPGGKTKTRPDTQANNSLLDSGVQSARIFERRLKTAIIARDLATLATLLPNASEKDLNSLEDTAENTRRLHSFPLGWAFTPSPKESEQPFTPLNAAVVRALVDARADISGRHGRSNWLTPLEVAMRNWPWDPLATRTALELGAPLDQPAARPPILQASTPRILSLLLESGASMSQQHPTGLRLPIMYLESYLPRLPDHDVMEKDASHFDRIMEDITLDRTRAFNFLLVLLAHGLNTTTNAVYILATEAQRAVRVPGMNSKEGEPLAAAPVQVLHENDDHQSRPTAEAGDEKNVGTDGIVSTLNEEAEIKNEKPEMKQLTFLECADLRVSEWVKELSARQALHSSYSMTYNPSELDPTRNGFLELVRQGAKHAGLAQHMSRMEVDPSARMAEAKAASELAESTQGATARAVAEADRVARIVDAHEAAENTKKRAKRGNPKKDGASSYALTAGIVADDDDYDDDDDDEDVDVAAQASGDAYAGDDHGARGLAYAAVAIELTDITTKDGGDHDK